VSIRNLTVARLEQFRLPQLRIHREHPTDVGVDVTSCRYLASESICR